MGTLGHPVSLQRRLSALIGLLALSIVAGVALGLTHARNQVLHQDLEHKAKLYASLLGRQLESVVAFDDHQTAREVFDAVAIDADVLSVGIYRADGSLIEGRAAEPSWSDPSGKASLEVRDEWLRTSEPVVSREGPRGTVVLRVSTDRLRQSQRDAIYASALLALAAIGVALLFAWAIAGTVARRLARIARVAERVGEGDLTQHELEPGVLDEIGRLTLAFNAMLSHLQRLMTQLKDTAASEQERLAGEVRRRTAELTLANESLASEMKARSQMELELRQAQKLESVGRLAAGVAHEINTPVQFVSDSIHFVRGAMDDLFGLVAKLSIVEQQVLRGEPAKAAALEATEAGAAADFPYLVQNVPKALSRALDGLDRVATIVRSMKEFSHPDTREMAAVDLNQAVQSTLVIASNEYKYVAELETDLGDLPMVLCHPGDLNQAVLNIIVNAAHAIADVVKGTERKGCIRVSTRADGADAVISISDTGTGIPTDVQGRIFDPFFTTKEVGRGTGQGLSIARLVVVDKHHGQLTFQTEAGKGTTFFIRVPLHGCTPTQAAA